MYEIELRGAGLDEKQAKVYLACLELGKAKVPEIARRSGIKRTTAYGILDELTALGFVGSSTKGNIKYFSAADPKSLIDNLEEKKKEIQNILPGLEEIYASYNVRPLVQFFEEKEGVKKIFEDTLKCKEKKIRQIVRVKDFVEFVGRDYSADYIKKRAEKNIVAYALHPKSDDIHDNTYGEESEKWKRHVRYLPPVMFYASMIMIYDHKVVMISTKKENFGFIIESREFSNTLKAYFDFMWNAGSKNPETDIGENI